MLSCPTNVSWKSNCTAFSALAVEHRCLQFDPKSLPSSTILHSRHRAEMSVHAMEGLSFCIRRSRAVSQHFTPIHSRAPLLQINNDMAAHLSPDSGVYRMFSCNQRVHTASSKHSHAGIISALQSKTIHALIQQPASTPETRCKDSVVRGDRHDK